MAYFRQNHSLQGTEPKSVTQSRESLPEDGVISEEREGTDGSGQGLSPPEVTHTPLHIARVDVNSLCLQS